MQGYRAARKSSCRKDFCGKRMNKRGWFPRGKITKQKTKTAERMLKKKALLEEIHAL